MAEVEVDQGVTYIYHGSKVELGFSWTWKK